MRIFNWFKKSKLKITEIEFQPSWEERCKIMDILEKEKYNFGIRKGKRDMSLINFGGIEELNNFLSEFKIIAKEINTHKILNSKTGELFIYIKLLPIHIREKNNFNNNLKKATIHFYKTNHIAVFYSP